MLNAHLSNELMPLNDDAKVNLLWDELQEGLLGGDERESKLDAKAREAAGGVFTDGEKNVGHEFRYMDLVDVEDGNVWVGTSSEPTTVFWPYPEGVTAEDEIAVVRFPGLTRDYTIDQDAEELEAAIEACDAEALAIEKTETGVLFEVPSCGFGPFELMWATDDEDVPGDDDTTTDDDDNDDDDNGGGDNSGGGDNTNDGGDKNDGNDTTAGDDSDNLPKTGDPTSALAVLGTVLTGGALVTGSFAARRRALTSPQTPSGAAPRRARRQPRSRD